MELSITEIGQRIYSVRGLHVVLDNDLAEFYQTKTKALNQAARRNSDRFPADFMFQLTLQEQSILLANVETIKMENRGGRRNLPYAFTQEGVSMLSGVLNNGRAVEVNILIMRAFVQLRQVSEAHLDLVKRFDRLETKCNEQYRSILRTVQNLEVVLLSKPVNHFPLFNGVVVKALEGPANKMIVNNLEVGSVTFKKEYRAKIDVIQQAVAKYFGMKSSALKSFTRARAIFLPRQIAIYFIRKRTGISFKEIGKLFGAKDHTNSIYAYKKISCATQDDLIIYEAIQAIQIMLS